MIDHLRLDAKTWVIRGPILGSNTYCMSLLYIKYPVITHIAIGCMASTQEEAEAYAKEAMREDFPASDGWSLHGIATSRIFSQPPS